MTWVTREIPQIDRIACPWLIRRFVEQTGAVPCNIPGAESFSQGGDLCSFNAFIQRLGLRDAALDRLATIERGADTATHFLAPEAAGLHAISMGLSADTHDDSAMPELGMVICDALYAWCRNAIAELNACGETHNRVPPGAKPEKSS